MKLLFCTQCLDIFNLTLKEKKCSCGKSGGQYIDELNAVYWGKCIPLGITNNSFIDAANNQPESGMGKEFTAFVIPRECDTFTKGKVKYTCNLCGRDKFDKPAPHNCVRGFRKRGLSYTKRIIKLEK